jgi:phage shock protein A
MENPNKILIQRIKDMEKDIEALIGKKVDIQWNENDTQDKLLDVYEHLHLLLM